MNLLPLLVAITALVDHLAKALGSGNYFLNRRSRDNNFETLKLNYFNIKQLFDKKNRISKIIQSSFDDIRRSGVEYLFYRLPKLRNR